MDINALIENYKDVFLNKFAKFDGRAGKREFWYFILVNLVVGFLISVVLPPLSYLFSLAVLIPSLAVSVRRMHDIGKSGWLVALVVIPVIGAIIVLVLAAQDAVPGPNQYGINPEPGPGSSDTPAMQAGPSDTEPTTSPEEPRI